ncbi:hypothetical protein AQJ46_42310 [Streptomyces canus]|uniref:Uncharacterized protein n=1 Tax=Streptomyces canus TaxID=58343 RepID=A0A101RNS0_9ACTN|nr:hypothetical protein [Streptomyces canus]KUN58909.1 hypothetical protein AQJ46_42310 [Streptomyces canus]
MKVAVAFDLGIPADEVEYTAAFEWDIGGLPLPPRHARIALGELTTVVDDVQYMCPPADYINSRDHHVPAVSVELWLRLTGRTKKGRYTPYEIHRILASLPCLSSLHVTGVDPSTTEGTGR